MSPQEALERWVIAALLGNAAVVTFAGSNVFSGDVPQGKSPPAVVVDFLAMDDVHTQWDSWGGSTALVEVRAILRGPDRLPAHAAAEGIRDALHGVNGTANSYTFDARRLSSESFQQTDNGETTQFVAQIFEVWVRPS